METYRIVVGIDGSEASDRGLDWAIREAATRGESGRPATVDAIIAWDFDPDLEPESVAVRLEDPQTTAERTLDHAVARAVGAHRDAVIAAMAVRGSPSEVLADASQRANLLVLGSHGHNRLYRAALGSVADACISAAACPVVVIPAAHAIGTHSAPLPVAARGRGQ